PLPRAENVAPTPARGAIQRSNEWKKRMVEYIEVRRCSHTSSRAEELQTQSRVVRCGASTFQLAEPGDHQAIGLARERRRQNRVALGIARQLLRERDEFLPAKRHSLTYLFGHPNIIARSPGRWQPQRYKSG